MTQSGCKVVEAKVKEAVFVDTPQTLRLKNPTQTAEQWLKSVGKSKYQDYSIDSYGGGYSLNFRKQSRGG